MARWLNLGNRAGISLLSVANLSSEYCGNSIIPQDVVNDIIKTNMGRTDSMENTNPAKAEVIMDITTF
jgi:hypothetical protein